MRYAFGEFTLDTDVFEIKRDGEALAAEPQVLDLLILLVESREKVVTRDELLAKALRRRQQQRHGMSPAPFLVVPEEEK